MNRVSPPRDGTCIANRPIALSGCWKKVLSEWNSSSPSPRTPPSATLETKTVSSALIAGLRYEIGPNSFENVTCCSAVKV
ncbi:MAG: hypothetical protein U1E23_06335 [Reyranellaceae bacterium]